MRFIGVVLLIISTMILGSTLFFSCSSSINFDQTIEGHIKRAADAQVVELAQAELSTAITAIEAQNLTTGYTSIFYRTPDEDMSFWYRNLKASQAELAAITPETTPLERSNVLMRLRSTLLDHGEHGEKVTSPNGIEIYPHNTMVFWANMFAMLMMILGGLFVTIGDDY